MTSSTTRRQALQAGRAALTVYLLPCDQTLSWASNLGASHEHTDSELAALEWELLERCRDFVKLDSVYDKIEDARSVYDDAYAGIIETAKWYHWTREADPTETRNDAWVHDVYPDDIAWVLRPDPPIHGLSDEFVELQSRFDAGLAALAEWSLIPTPDWWAHEAKMRSIGKVTNALWMAQRAISSARAVTRGDRALKRRAIEYRHCGRGGRLAKALHAAKHPSAPSRDQLMIRIGLQKKHVPFEPSFRADWRDWESIYA